MSAAEITWVCCPGGLENGELHVAVVAAVSVQPDTDTGTLADAVGLDDWPATLRGVTWGFEFEPGSPVTAHRPGRDPDSALWSAMFPGDTLLLPPGRAVDRSNQPVVTYPVAQAAEAVRGAYAAAAAAEAVGDRARSAAATRATFDIGTLADFRTDLVSRVTQTRAACAARGVEDRAPLTVAPSARNTPVAQAYAMQVLPRIAPSGRTYEATAVDFHHAQTLLGHYPWLLRRLGLVVDLTMDVGDLSEPVSRIRLQADGLPDGFTHRNPWTQVLLVAPAGRFAAAARDPGYQDGVWPLDRAEFTLEHLDVDSAVRNGVALVAHPANDEDPGTLPALRNDGIALVHTGRANHVVDRVAAASRRRRDLRADASLATGEELSLEDLSRGSKVDVWDDAVGRWRSLHARRIRCSVDGFGTLQPDAGDWFEDEGWLQTAVTGEEDLYVHEKLATWRGWSLSAPSPYPAASDPMVGPDPTTDNLSALYLHIETEVQPGTLPRLRYGHTYRFRVRTVDLAGGCAGLDVAPDASTRSLKYLRYEPVPPPVVEEAASSGPGEDVHHMVVRRRASTDDFLVPIEEMWDTSERLLVPPRGSLAQAEQHGMLDDLLGPGKAHNAAALRDIAARTATDLVGGDVAPWLPDPMAAGLAFTGLPGLGGGEVFTVMFEDDTWPDIRPVRLRAMSWEAYIWATDSVPLSYDPVERTITVYLREGERFLARVSCIPRWPEQSALVADCTTAQPEAHDAVLDQVRSGVHPMVSPSVELELVHATFEASPPSFDRPVTPVREAGSGEVGWNAGVAVDPATVGSLDLVASWEEPVDRAPADPGGQPDRVARTATLLTRQVRQDESIVVLDTDAQHFPRTELGTGFRRVMVQPVAMSRFGDCYPAGALVSAAGAAVEVLVPNTAVPPPVVMRAATPSIYVASPAIDRPEDYDDTAIKMFGGPDDLDMLGGSIRITQTRSGGGIRLWLERPWNVTGDGELLGVVVVAPEVLQGVLPPGDDMWVFDRTNPIPQWCSQWGQDPERRAHGVTPLTEAVFRGALRTDPIGLLPDARDQSGAVSWQIPATILGYQPEYDPTRDLWFADVRLDTGLAYRPFVRLAVVRYQPNSLSEELSLSRVTTVQPVQPLPDRTLTLVRHGPGPSATLTLRGSTYAPVGDADRPRVSCLMFTGLSVDAPIWALADGFPVAPGDPMSGVELVRDPALPLWTTDLDLPPVPQGQVGRLVVVEKEGDAAWGRDRVERVVYVGQLDLPTS